MKYKCLYNHELLDVFDCLSPYLKSFREPVHRGQIEGFVNELAGTDVDALMICPTAWRLPLYRSKVDPRWDEKTLAEEEPGAECDLKYYEKAYHRIKRYMKNVGEDPVQITVDAAKKNGIAPFLSYRMNDHHYMNHEDSPTHSPIWRDHWEYRLPNRGESEPKPGGMNILNYEIEAVRDWYFETLKELAENYDFEGIEFDFLRSPRFFPDGKEMEDTVIMTDFVRRVRAMLDNVGAKRGKRLLLGARVPWAVIGCTAKGLDMLYWESTGLIDFINISTFAGATSEVRIDSFVKQVKKAKTYGELNFITVRGKTPFNYSNNINRRTTVEQYRTIANNYLSDGADGISFFNFMYTRDHYFSDPRYIYSGDEPPFKVLKGITDKQFLARQPRHFIHTPQLFGKYLLEEVPGLDTMPITFGAHARRTIEWYVADDPSSACWRAEGAIKIEFDKPAAQFQIDVLVNGVALKQFYGRGELFDPFAHIGLVAIDYMKHYRLPMSAIKRGVNTVEIIRRCSSSYDKNNVAAMVFEAAFYIKNYEI